MERITPNTATKKTKLVAHLESELEKYQKQKAKFRVQIEKFMVEHVPISQADEQMKIETLRFEYRRFSKLVSHVETFLYQARVFPIIHQGKPVKA